MARAMRLAVAMLITEAALVSTAGAAITVKMTNGLEVRGSMSVSLYRGADFQSAAFASLADWKSAPRVESTHFSGVNLMLRKWISAPSDCSAMRPLLRSAFLACSPSGR